MGRSVAEYHPSTMVFSVVEKHPKNQTDDKKRLTFAKKDALKSMLTRENKKRQDVFLETRQRAIQQKREIEVKDLIRKSVNLDKQDLESLEDTEEMCCQQCNTPVPLVCWRFSIKYYLQSSQL